MAPTRKKHQNGLGAWGKDNNEKPKFSTKKGRKNEAHWKIPAAD